jgi:molecular chaperone HtpG
VQVRALVYIPRHRDQGIMRLRTEEGLQLYSHNVLIQEYCTDLLPKHFRFVTGVVDSEDLPLNISRETVQLQSNRVMERMRNLLTKRVQSELERLAADAPDDYRTFWTAFSVYLKEGVATDPGAREPLARLLRYPSSATTGDELTSLQAYVDRMKPEQDAIYYVLADDQRSAAASPHLDPFKARDLEVLYFIEPIDSFVAVSLTEFAGKKLRNADDPDISLPPLDEATQAAQPAALSGADFAPLLLRVREVLGDRVLEVREGKTLTASPCRLVSPPGADRDLQRVRRYMDQQYEVPKKILELNRSSPLIRGLAARVQANPADPTVDLIIEQLYDSALLQEGLHPNPAGMVGRIQQLMEAAVGGAGARATSASAPAPAEPEAVESIPEPATAEATAPQVITGEVITEE